MSNIKRVNCGGYDWDEYECSHGDYVYYEDHLIVVKEKDKEIERLEAVLCAAEYNNVPHIKNGSIDQCKSLGKAVAQLSKDLAEERDLLKAELSQLKSRQSGVVLPDALSDAFITCESGNGEYRVVIKSETLKEVQQIHNWLARLNSSAVSAGNPEKVSYQDDPRSPTELGQLGCNCVRFGEDNPHWPCKLHAKLNPAEQLNKAQGDEVKPINQCDGCQAGIPLVNGSHRMGAEGEYCNPAACTAHLYKT